MQMNLKKTAAWRWLSIYVRLRDAKRTTGTLTEARCISCGRVRRLKQLDAGHYLPAIHRRTFFNEENVHGECDYCNTWDEFHLIGYRRSIVALYGEDKVQWLEGQKGSKQFRGPELKALSDYYRKRAYEVGYTPKMWENL
jgi:hypothetical protein